MEFIEKHNSSAFTNLVKKETAESLGKMGDYEKSIKLYREICASESAPAWLKREARFASAHLLFRSGDVRNAIAEMERLDTSEARRFVTEWREFLAMSTEKPSSSPSASTAKPSCAATPTPRKALPLFTSAAQPHSPAGPPPPAAPMPPTAGLPIIFGSALVGLLLGLALAALYFRLRRAEPHRSASRAARAGAADGAYPTAAPEEGQPESRGAAARRASLPCAVRDRALRMDRMRRADGRS